MHAASFRRSHSKLSKEIVSMYPPTAVYEDRPLSATTRCGLGRGLGTGSGLWENSPYLAPSWCCSHLLSFLLHRWAQSQISPMVSLAFCPPASHQHQKGPLVSPCRAPGMTSSWLPSPTPAPVSACATQSKWLDPVMLQFPHLSNGDVKNGAPMNCAKA